MRERIVILGGGESGVGAAILAQEKGFDVFVSDFGTIQAHYQDMLNKAQIDWEEKTHTESSILNAQTVIKSPGIPDNAPIVLKIKEKNIPVISEIEWAARYTDAYLIAISGSNGKTTTASLTYELLKNAGYNVGLAGNIGQSFALQVAKENYDYYVLELSSFQLDGMYQFKANIAVLMNITPDHLDRYNNNFQEYIDSKFRILQNQTEQDYFICCEDDPIIKEELKKRSYSAQKLPFSIETNLQKGACLEGDNIVFKGLETPFQIPAEDLSLKGKHNIYNSMASALAAHICGAGKEDITQTLKLFQNIEHRLEDVLTLKGVRFINDSKATNVNSTWYALESMQQAVVWIVGGVDKGNDYSQIMPLVKDKVKAIVCLGVDNSKLHQVFGDVVEHIVDTTTMKEAVQTAYQLSESGETVLLSPACASFDLFKNYEDRGKQFKQEVQNL